MLKVDEGHYSACWFCEEASKDADQDEVARQRGLPPPTSIQDFSDVSALPTGPGQPRGVGDGSPEPAGTADPTNPASPTAPPNLDTNEGS